MLIDEPDEHKRFPQDAILEALPPPSTLYAYAGPVVSGATLGAWERRELNPNQLESNAAWRHSGMHIPLEMLADLPTLAAERASLDRWEASAKAGRRQRWRHQGRPCCVDKTNVVGAASGVAERTATRLDHPSTGTEHKPRRDGHR